MIGAVSRDRLGPDLPRCRVRGPWMPGGITVTCSEQRQTPSLLTFQSPQSKAFPGPGWLLAVPLFAPGLELEKVRHVRPLRWGVRSLGLVFRSFACCSLDVSRDDVAYGSVTQRQRAQAWGGSSVSASVEWSHSGMPDEQVPGVGLGTRQGLQMLALVMTTRRRAEQRTPVRNGWPGYSLQTHFDDSGPDRACRCSLSGLFRASCVHGPSALSRDPSHFDVPQDGIRNLYFPPLNVGFESRADDWGGARCCLKRWFHSLCKYVRTRALTGAAPHSRGLFRPPGVTQSTSAGSHCGSAPSCCLEEVAAGGRTGGPVRELRDRESPGQGPPSFLGGSAERSLPL